VLLKILGRAQQPAAQRLVLRRIGTTGCCPGQHPGQHLVAAAPDEQLRCRADQPVHRERPAVGVAVGQPAQHEPGVDDLVGTGDQVVGQHDLVERAGPDPGDRCLDGLPEGGDGDRAAGVPKAARCIDPVQNGCRRRSAADGGQPRGVVTPSDQHLWYDEHGARRAVVVEREAAEGDRAAAREAELVLD
jgi:hypothetical protein